jgi:hypothetical protein
LRKIYIITLTLGLILVTTGVYFLKSNQPAVTIPKESPIILSNALYDFGGKSLTTYIYENGNVIYTEEINLRLQIPPDSQPTRIWKTGNIQDKDLAGVLQLFETTEFNELPEYNDFPGQQQEDGSPGFGDMYYTVTIYSGNSSKTIHADRYISYDNEKTYPGMPYPLNEIYEKIKQITDNQTTEVYREPIKK